MTSGSQNIINLTLIYAEDLELCIRKNRVQTIVRYIKKLFTQNCTEFVNYLYEK